MRAILKPGDIVLADEPTGSLDPEMSQKAFDLIRTLRDNLVKQFWLLRITWSKHDNVIGSFHWSRFL